MTKTDFAELKERLTKLDDELAIKMQFEKEVTEYRYAVYPDADKDAIQTLLADAGCHGYFDAAFIGVKTEHTKSAAIITELLEIIQSQSEALESCVKSASLIYHCYCDESVGFTCEGCFIEYRSTKAISETNTRLQKLRDNK